MLVLMRITKGKIMQNEEQQQKINRIINQEETTEVKLSFKEWLAPRIIDPMGKYALFFDIVMACVYLSAFFIDPVIFCFKFEPLEIDSIRLQQQIITVAIVVNMLL